MASILSTLLGGWGTAEESCHIRRLAALEEGEIVCSEYGALSGLSGCSARIASGLRSPARRAGRGLVGCRA
jgi:hypothetical protein